MVCLVEKTHTDVRGCRRSEGKILALHLETNSPQHRSNEGSQGFDVGTDYTYRVWLTERGYIDRYFPILICWLGVKFVSRRIGDNERNPDGERKG
jgi:hypothetical protein